MKVIFLDIDGVMNCYHKDEKWSDRKDRVHMIHDDLVERLNQIVEKTGAKMVLSSTWRKTSDWHEIMNAAGIKDVWLGRTICLDKERFASGTPGAEWMGRGKEIQAWLDENKVERYCILDDDSDMLPHQKHFKTSIFTGGLTQSISDEVIEYLNS